MTQPVPQYTDEDLQRIVNRDYAAESRAQVMAILQSYGADMWQHESLRVRMACLKLAGGKMADLSKYVGDARADYRDVLAWAEYPAYMRARGPEEQEQAIDADWQQLQNWLHRDL
jgi:hypothetical protein